LLNEDAASQHRINRHGVGWMVLAMAFFIVNDALVKWVSQSLPAAQLIFVRGLFATALVLAVMRASGVPWRAGLGAGRWLPIRAGVDALATFAYLVSLFHLPLANATAINMASPLFIALMSVAWLGQRVTAGRWLAMAVGFAGVLLVIQPDAGGFNAYAWLCLLATVLHALRDLATPRIPRQVPSLAITLATAAAVTVLAGLASLWQGWRPMTPVHYGLLAAAAVFLAAGYQGVILATRRAELSVVAPFRYSGLLIAVLIGWVVWSEVPNALGLAGIVLVMAAGLWLLRGPRPA
jgi:drug/metabolite transporter (DMT)-like permease